MPVNKERVQLWVDALRSDRYLQAKSRLFDAATGGYCCLGVATEVCLENAGDALTGVERLEAGESLRLGYLPTEAVAAWFGFDEEVDIPDGEDPGYRIIKDPRLQAFYKPDVSTEEVQRAEDSSLDGSYGETPLTVEQLLTPYPPSEDSESRGIQASSANDYGNWTFEMIADAIERTYLFDDTVPA